MTNNINPCSQCLVSSMCITPCDSFIDYVQNHLEIQEGRPFESQSSYGLMVKVAKGVRTGKAKLTFNRLGYILYDKSM